MITSNQIVEVLKQYDSENPGALDKVVPEQLAGYLLKAIINAIGEQGSSPIQLFSSLIAIEERLREEGRDASFGCWIAGGSLWAGLFRSSGVLASSAGYREPYIVDAIKNLGRSLG